MIRQAYHKDLDRLIEMNQNLTTHHHHLDRYFLPGEKDPGVHEYMKRRLDDKYSRIFVHEEDDKIKGYLVARVKKADTCLEPDRFGKISQVYVDPEERQKGVGTELMHNGLGWLEKEGVKNIELPVHAKNPDALGFYKKFGFQDYKRTLRKDL